MKPKVLLFGALFAFFAALGVLIASWNGKLTVTGASPISSSSIQLSGSATGWPALAGLAGLLLAVVLFVWGLISLATRGVRRRDQEQLAEAPPAAEAKKEAASH